MNWELELCEDLPEEFTLTQRNTYLQRKDIHEVKYHSLDGMQTFHGYECFVREIPISEYNLITNHIN